MVKAQSSTSTPIGGWKWTRSPKNRSMAAMTSVENVAECRMATRSENDTLYHERWQWPP